MRWQKTDFSQMCHSSRSAAAVGVSHARVLAAGMNSDCSRHFTRATCKVLAPFWQWQTSPEKLISQSATDRHCLVKRPCDTSLYFILLKWQVQRVVMWTTEFWMAKHLKWLTLYIDFFIIFCKVFFFVTVYQSFSAEKWCPPSPPFFFFSFLVC